MMTETQKNIVKALQNLKSKYPDVKEVTVDFEGSGDSFGEFYDHTITFKDVVFGDKSEIEDKIIDEICENVVWDIISETDANFNNDGSSGTITIDFEKNTYECSVEHYYRESMPGNGVEGSFAENELKSYL